MTGSFFARDDLPAADPTRDLVGYGEHLPRVRWPGDARVALQLVVNYEEGAEKSYAMGDGVNDGLAELPLTADTGRDLSVESVYEYGSRAGIWRLFRIFDAAGVPVTFFAAAVALERNPAVARRIAERGDEPGGHGYRWSNAYEMTRDEEREAIARAIESIERTTGTRPVGWFSRRMSVNTRALLVEEGGFEYDSEAFNDDLPYWVTVGARPHLVVPYTQVFNDGRFVLSQGFGSPDDFLDYLRRGLDRLRDDGDDASRMMSVGLHPRLIGNPARADALARFIDYAQQCDDVWIARRIDIARTFAEQFPADLVHSQSYERS